MSNANALKIAGIVRDAGGRVIGRTRLQKIAYLLFVTGLETDLQFAYKHYGPFSGELAIAARDAGLLGLLRETEEPASWGGTYSTYAVTAQPDPDVPPARLRLAAEAAAADAVELELAATAVFLAKEGHSDPWAETTRRKPQKAENGRIDRAKDLFLRLSEISTPVAWPSMS